MSDSFINGLDPCPAGGDTGNAGSDCQWWDGNDYVTVDPCWGVGARPPAPVCRPLVNQSPRMANTLVYSVHPLWSPGFLGGDPGAATLPCPLNSQSTGTLDFTRGWFFNAGTALALSACTSLDGGDGTTGLAAIGADPLLVGTTLDTSSYQALRASARAQLRPSPTSPLRAAGLHVPDLPSDDASGATRPSSPSIGALE